MWNSPFLMWLAWACVAWFSLGCGATPPPKAEDPLGSARARYARSQEYKAEEKAAKSELVRVLGSARDLNIELADRAEQDARQLEQERCELDPTGCTLAVASVLIALYEEQTAEKLLVQVEEMSPEGASLLPGSAQWAVWLDAERMVVYSPDNTASITIRARDLGKLPACVAVDSEGKWARMDCPLPPPPPAPPAPSMEYPD